MASTFNARDAAAYERTMGRWSRRLAPGFVAFAALEAPRRILDVGCGPGSLLFHLAQDRGTAELTGIDASPVYVAAAAAANTDPRVTVQAGDACAMPFGDGAFDAALSQLVLQFVPDPLAALREMRRVVRSGGRVAAAVWCSGGGMPHQRMFWDIAALLDPAAGRLRDAAFSRPMTRWGDLRHGCTEVGLVGVAESSVTIWMTFEDFADFWQPLASGEGTLGKYVAGLLPGARDVFQGHLRDAYLAGQPDGMRPFACTAFVCRGTVPG